jgi:hypothetical protein
MLRAAMDRVDSTQNQTGNFSRKMISVRISWKSKTEILSMDT